MPKLEQYLKSGECRLEPQFNEKYYEGLPPADSACKGVKCLECKRCYVLKKDSGILLATQFCDRLKSKVDDLLKK